MCSRTEPAALISVKIKAGHCDKHCRWQIGTPGLTLPCFGPALDESRHVPSSLRGRTACSQGIEGREQIRWPARSALDALNRPCHCPRCEVTLVPPAVFGTP